MKFSPAGSGEVVEEQDYSKMIIFSSDDLQVPGHLLQVVTVPPHTKQRLHLHRQQTEVFYVLEGQAKMKIGGKEFAAQPGDAFICGPGDRHRLWNQSGADFRLVVFKINKPEEDDTAWCDGRES
jgi:mannose-6-phosphate isomerase-like protein (cupin superfamily)